MKLLKFNFYSKSNIYPFISPIFWFIRYYFSNTEILNPIFNNNKLYLSLLIFFSEFLSIIGLIILYINTRTEKVNQKKNEDIHIIQPIPLISKKNFPKYSLSKIIIIVTLITIFDMEDNIYFNDIKNGGWSQDSIRALELIITSLLCKTFIYISIKTHNILSIILF